MKRLTKDHFYHLWIAAADEHIFFADTLDKAFFVSLFQDNLSPRKNLDMNNPFINTTSPQVALVAYSLTKFGVNILVTAPRDSMARAFGQILLIQYMEYLSHSKKMRAVPFDTIFTHDHIDTEYEALQVSKEIHHLHEGDHYDRYSSIGFYIYDRRGDWIQPWRLTRLYKNDNDWYVQFLEDETMSVSNANHYKEFIEI